MTTLLSTQSGRHGLWGRTSQQGLQGAVKSLTGQRAIMWFPAHSPAPSCRQLETKESNSEIRSQTLEQKGTHSYSSSVD
jgi:hypothetical protein